MPSGITAELSANYQSTQVYGTYVIKPIYSIDLGISKSFLNNKLNAKLAANDLFNTQIAKVSSAVPLRDYQLSQKQESRTFRFTISYNFGSSVIKAVRDRVNGASGEQNRVKAFDQQLQLSWFLWYPKCRLVGACHA